MSKKSQKLEGLVVEERKRQVIADLRFLVSTQQGRRIYWRLLQKARTFDPSFDPSASMTSYREGKRSVGLELMQEVTRYAPAEHVLTLNEQLSAQSEDEARRRAEEAKADRENGD